MQATWNSPLRECFNPFNDIFKFGNVKPQSKWVGIFGNVN